MLAIDILLFFCLFFLDIICFLLLHFISLRLFRNIGLLYSSAWALCLSVLLVAFASYFLVSGWFSTFNSYTLSVLGSGLAAIFAGWLYTFLGPATADRSLASHLLVLLYNAEGAGSTREDIYRRYNPEEFVEKRIDECRQEKLITERNGSIVLTEKGKSITRIYLFLLSWLRLRGRDGYVEYFRNL